ncbi:hypothetical protein LRS06_13640 [Hymenobacter sp. J193]|uniref:toxin-antitoxin system YwqK family antitoxin n=1 Tax=Hymenobacter sp. J193 TaxID=2898429 RepID=UPI0021515D26|nr:hypothetical protein [Hymenobacter sp. J193]MCR5888792.1 hypothetical protein [Hymenobacter sp. J193]
MKTLVLIIGLFCLSGGAISQSMPAIYLNEQGEEVVPDSATHYRIIDRKTDAGYTIREHTINGTLLLRGTFASIDPVWRTGLFTWYHPNGTKASQVHFEDDEPAGVYVAWYENGKVRERGQFEEGQRTGRWVTVHRNGQKRSEGRYLYGRPVGEWRYYYDNGQLSAIELLNRAKGPALAFFNLDGSPFVGKLQRRQMPEFPGGSRLCWISLAAIPSTRATRAARASAVKCTCRTQLVRTAGWGRCGLYVVWPRRPTTKPGAW